MSAALLEVENLSVEFATEAGPLRAVEQVSFRLEAGRTLGLVGESGCGKSVTSLALMGLLPGNGRIAGGSIRFDGQDLTTLAEAELRRLRGKRLSMIFQEPMTALNPVYRAGDQIIDVLRRHEGLSRRAARDRAVEMLSRVGIPAPEQRMADFPHQMSGGMRQRVMIAMALVCRPRLLIADEPTTALDVTTQAQVLAEISQLAAELGTAVLLITHDLGVVAETCDEVLVMYAGRVVEQAPVDALFAKPRHRYTEGLLASIPRIRPDRLERLPVISGTVPELAAMPAGCRFAARCAHAREDCRERSPELRALGQSRVACFYPAGAE
ncbi:MAG: peptide ABC transporter ATP-binding protein [Gammaproteobacteria bacterium HGW-Gammaproteobacteria-8]|nr:MAG: peptide ABC transporter ATP-binding protein [Gammaproteobacteria bacterium HGW-Gammaproteobacteria-8]